MKNYLKIGLAVTALFVMGSGIANAQVHSLSTDVLAPAKVDVSFVLNNAATQDSTQLLVRAGVTKNVEALVGQGYGQGQTYLGVKVNLLGGDTSYKLVAGIYQYSTRGEQVTPYVLGSWSLGKNFTAFGGGIAFSGRFEPNFGVDYTPVTKFGKNSVVKSLRYRAEYQGNGNEYLVLSATAVTTRTTEFTVGLNDRNPTRSMRFYPYVGVTFHVK